MKQIITQNRQDLDRLEEVISKNLKSFYEVGKALMEIRDQELYKLKHGGQYETFEAYCKGEWDFRRAHAYRLMDSVKVIDNVSESETKSPVNLEQTRPLTKLDPEKQREAWRKAVETAPEGKVTATHVAKVVREIAGDQLTGFGIKPAKPATPDDTVALAENAINQLKRIVDGDPNTDAALYLVENWIKQQRAKNVKMLSANIPELKNHGGPAATSTPVSAMAQ
ncbi:MAG TPA: hypothetical protein PLP16_09725 [Smithellaceae bacterium]|nr:hypothetical protein [Smithellaceae bacterium]